MSAKNPYRPPAAELESFPDVKRRPVGLLITAVINAVFTMFIAYRARERASGFRELFASFGADLGAATMIVLKTWYVWYLIAAVGLGLAIWVGARAELTRVQHARMKLAVRLFSVCVALAVAFTVYALYKPIFALGAAV